MHHDSRHPQPAKAVLKRRGISQRNIARAIGRDEGWVSRVLDGHRPPTAALAKTVAEACGMPESELFRPERGQDWRPRSPEGPLERRRDATRAARRAAVAPALAELRRARIALRRIADGRA